MSSSRLAILTLLLFGCRQARATVASPTTATSDDQCTAIGEDPYNSGHKIECCTGLQECLGNFDYSGRWFYKCAPYCEAKEYNLHFDTTDDYLNIGAKIVDTSPDRLKDYYYVVMGDQGGCGGCPDCCSMQYQVAAKLKKYVENRKASNPRSTLLFVLLVGDNFYWSGAGADSFKKAWADVYGPELTDVPWFGVLGNHDYGNNDGEIVCPMYKPRLVCNSTNALEPACGGPKPYSTKTQYYASNQLNANKGGLGGELRANFHMPDFAYHYKIPKLNLEMIGLDYNWYDRDGLGGNGLGGGAEALRAACGNDQPVYRALAAIRDASTRLLHERAQARESRNVAIFSHYPDWFQSGINLRNEFLEAAKKHAKPFETAPKTFNFYGHTHIQKCIKKEDGECTDYLTGGSGGCCGHGDIPAGFVAITFAAGSDGIDQAKECFTPDADCTVNRYHQSAVEKQSLERRRADICAKTNDDQRCPNYHGGSEHEGLPSLPDDDGEDGDDDIELFI